MPRKRRSRTAYGRRHRQACLGNVKVTMTGSSDGGSAMSEVVTEIRGKAGLITLDRPRAMNALSLDMIRGITATLLAWAGDVRVQRVAVRGMGREGPFGTFCAGGDIRFFHQAV